MKKKHT
jgi:hypothetical protein